jgi:hypothetical protein
MFHVGIEILQVKDHYKAYINGKIQYISKILGKVKDVFTFVSSKITFCLEVIQKLQPISRLVTSRFY